MDMDSDIVEDEGKKKRVLIADGSTFMCIMLTAMMEKLHFEVVGTSKDGNDAIEKYMNLKPDVVIVDPGLRKKDGIEVTSIITQEDPSAVVIMLLTGTEADSEIIVEAVRAGAKGYMRKPIAEGEIKNRIESALKRR
ncbi:MAG: response regulator [Halobacteriota archaeon]